VISEFASIAKRPLLDPQNSPQYRASQTRPSTEHPSLWLCLYFPKLALEALPLNDEDTPLRAVLEKDGRRALIHTASKEAESAGVGVGMTQATAHALCPSLALQPRDLQGEIQVLEELATWATRFTPVLSLAPPQALLLEIGASLRLFGGLSTLRRHIHNGISAQGHVLNSAITATPLASLLLATHHNQTVVSQKEELRSALARLPINSLPLQPRQRHRLNKAGIYMLQDLWRLPRDGLARRFGPQLLDTMDRALGLKPEPRELFRTPEHFQANREPCSEVYDTTMLLQGVWPLLEHLTDYLRRRDAGTTGIRLDLRHARGRTSQVEIGVRHCTRDIRHLFNLLQEHLNRLRLTAPVTEIRLSTIDIHPFTATTPCLFVQSEPTHIPTQQRELEWQRVLDHLQARLGRKALHGLQAIADHRPERAWGYTSSVSAPCCLSSRPLWLLPSPLPLRLHHHHPWHQGPLLLLSDPERIEGGWWDNQDIRRDYFTATDIDGSRLWIFRDLHKDNAWYLHGYFG
jgi:protein ImuB